MNNYNKEVSTKVATAIVAFLFSLIPLAMFWAISGAGTIINFKWILLPCVCISIFGYLYPEKFPKFLDKLWRFIFNHE